MTSVLDPIEIKEEIIVFLRNADIYTTTQRSVTTATATGTFSSASSLLLNRTNVRNIRSITVGGVVLSFGTDYTVDYTYLDTTIKCKITFTSAQTGAYSIPYDYGTDIIFVDRPRIDLSISSFPRVSVEYIGEDSQDAEANGDTEEVSISFGISVFDKKSDDIDSKQKTIKEKIIAAKKSFYYLRYVRRLNLGPLLPYNLSKGKVDFKTANYLSQFNLETV